MNVLLDRLDGQLEAILGKEAYQTYRANTARALLEALDPEAETTEDPSEPDLADTVEPETKPTIMKYNVAICVGHSRSGDAGAGSVGGVTEHSFNTVVARMLRAKLEEREIGSFVVDRYVGHGYSAAMYWLASHLKNRGADIALELHFNAASPQAKGFEYLHYKTSNQSKRLARCLLDAQASAWPNRTNRGTKGRLASERGGSFLYRTHCPAVICEPFFGSNREEWEFYQGRQSGLASVYADGVAKFLG